MGYSRLQQVNEWLQWVTAGYREVTLGYSRLLFAVRVPTGVRGCFLVTEFAYWCLWVATGVCAYLLVSVDAYCCLMLPTGV